MDDTPTPTGTGPTANEPQDPVRVILEALGGCPVLLPIPRGRKGPFYDGWQSLTWLDTQNPDTRITFARPVRDSMGETVRDESGAEKREIYRESTYGALLAESVRERGNLGVLLGDPSRLRIELEGCEYLLVSIDVDSDAAAAAFLGLNPGLAGTLRTRGRRGCNFWLWVERESCVRSSHKLFFAGPDGAPDKKRAWGEWRSTGNQTVIWGIHPEGNRYERLGEGRRPLRVTMGEIAWPADLAVPWRKTPAEILREKFGEPWFKSKKGNLTLNRPWFVGKYAQEHRLLYEPEEGQFYEYNPANGLWQLKSEDVIQWEFSEDFKRIADETAETALLGKRDNASLRGLVQQLRGAVERRDAFKKERSAAGVIHLKNGMLDLRVDPPELREFSPDYFSRNQVPVVLDESAAASDFLQFISCYRPEDRDVLQLWAGSVLLTVNLAQRFLIIYGTSGAGKSTFINLMCLMIGEENTVELRTENLTERFEMSAYVGKTLLVGSDVPGNFLQQEGAYKIKSLVGNDLLTAEFKQGGAQRIRGIFNVGMSCNSRLTIKLDGDAAAYRRRMLPILHDAPPPETPDPQLLDRLFRSEGSGILNWMIEGACKLLAQFKAFGAMQLHEIQKQRIDSLLAASDSVHFFVRTCTEKAHGDTVTSTELSVAYVQFCERQGWKPEPERRAAGKMLDAVQEIHHLARSNDIKRKTGPDGEEKSQKGYRGLRLHIPPAEAAADA